jgi:hypothetical protein
MNRSEVPGYEFEVPRGPRHASGPRRAVEREPTLQFPREQPESPGDQFQFRREQQPQFRGEQFKFQREQPEPEPRPSVRAASSGVLAVMRTRNWLMGLAVPILAAITVGIAVVVVTGGGGNGGTAPSALAAGFPPARLAGASFTGTAGTSRVILSAIGASAGTEVAAGGVNGGPALWVSSDGGTTWARVTLAGLAPLTRAGTGQLAGIAHGPAGWLAVGSTLAGKGGLLVASSPDARNWTATAGITENAVAAAAAAGPAGYVIVGHQTAGAGGGTVAAAWYAPGLTGWRSATVTEPTQPGTSGGQMMNAVTATSRGFAAVGAAGTSPAAWLSATGRTWQQVQVPTPSAAARAALEYVAANGSDVVAAGTEFSPAGASSPFVEASADAGATWAQVQLPVPNTGSGTGTTVTALTAAGGGFTAVGTYVTQAGPQVVIWTLPPGAAFTDGGAWTAVTPQGAGLASTAAENTITALAADGATLTGVGFTAALTKAGMPGPQQPTLWQSPIRY